MNTKQIKEILWRMESYYKYYHYCQSGQYAAGQLVIVSAAGASHYQSLQQFVESALKHEPEAGLIVYHLGFEHMQHHEFVTLFPGVDLRAFEYSRYPPYFDIKINAGEYAWKPIIVAEVLNQYQCSVCWIDAGNVILRPLVRLRRVLNALGFYAP